MAKPPAHLRSLAEAFRRGESDVIEPLHDALLELGYAVTAALHFGKKPCTPGAHCDAVRGILNGLNLDCLEATSICWQLRRQRLTEIGN